MKNWKTYTYLIITYLLMHVGSIFLSKYLFESFPWDASFTKTDKIYRASAWALFSTNAVAAIVFFFIIYPKKKFFQVFKGKKVSVGKAIIWGFFGFLLALAGQIIAGSIESAFGVKPGSENTALLADIAKVSPIIIFSIVLFAPLLEEIIFRRVLFGGLYQKTNFIVAAVLSALVFAAVHGELQHILIYSAPALVFSFIYYKTKRLLAPITAHLLMNGFVTILQLYQERLLKWAELKTAFSFFIN
ncbi:CPBP family intramembrane glutamic endopeptidase [Sporosarcina siberiensis]|uniref:CPBP family intramembrane glutamic endopeptidase n=1 Tax=Sporosarcina siberiensis TaxID=1365606 RepID=A0ABW4SKR2_9BACL